MSEDCKNKSLKDKMEKASELRKRFFGSCENGCGNSFCSNPMAESFINFAFLKKFSVKDKIFK